MCQARGTYSASHFSMVAFASRIASPSAARAFAGDWGASVHLNMIGSAFTATTYEFNRLLDFSAYGTRAIRPQRERRRGFDRGGF